MKKIRVSKEEAEEVQTYFNDHAWIQDTVSCLARGESVILVAEGEPGPGIEWVSDQLTEKLRPTCSECGLPATPQDLEGGLCGGCR